MQEVVSAALLTASFPKSASLFLDALPPLFCMFDQPRPGTTLAYSEDGIIFIFKIERRREKADQRLMSMDNLLGEVLCARVAWKRWTEERQVYCSCIFFFIVSPYSLK